MADKLHTIKIRNGKSGYVFDLVDDFDFVCLEGATYPSSEEYKDLAKTSYYDEHGDDVYHPKVRYKKSFDIEIPIGCTGSRKGYTLGMRIGIGGSVGGGGIIGGGAVGSGDYSVKQKLYRLESELNGTAGELSHDGLSIYMAKENVGYNGCDLKAIKDKEYQCVGDYETFTCTLVFGVSNPDDEWIYSTE